MKPPLTDERLAHIKKFCVPSSFMDELWAHIDSLKAENESHQETSDILEDPDAVSQLLASEAEMDRTCGPNRGRTALRSRGSGLRSTPLFLAALDEAMKAAEPYCTGYGSMCNCSVHKAIASIRALAEPDAAGEAC